MVGLATHPNSASRALERGGRRSSELGTQVVVEGGGAATLPASLLQPIRRAKYPALSAEEEAISLPLQTLCQARQRARLLTIVCLCHSGRSPTPS